MGLWDWITKEKQKNKNSCSVKACHVDLVSPNVRTFLGWIFVLSDFAGFQMDLLLNVMWSSLSVRYPLLQGCALMEEDLQTLPPLAASPEDG